MTTPWALIDALIVALLCRWIYTELSSFIQQAQIYAKMLCLLNFRAKAQAELQLLSRDEDIFA